MNLNIEEVMNEIVLIRGLPGSGKSTLAKSKYGYKHFEADMYFEINGPYLYDHKRIRNAHDWFLTQAKLALENSENVVIAKTFCSHWELQPYLELGFPARIEIASGSFKNIHGVPIQTIEKMRTEWQD